MRLIAAKIGRRLFCHGHVSPAIGRSQALRIRRIWRGCTMRVPLLWGSIHWTGTTTFASAVSRIVFNN